MNATTTLGWTLGAGNVLYFEMRQKKIAIFINIEEFFRGCKVSMVKAKANQNTSLLSRYYIAQKIAPASLHMLASSLLLPIIATVEEWCRKTIALCSF
jgi:hypothetical protein